MLEFFLIAVIFILVGLLVLITLSTLNRIEKLAEEYKKNLDVIYRYLLKIHTKDDLTELLENHSFREHESIVKVLDNLRINLVTQMGDLASKHDFCKMQDNLDEIIEVKTKLKQDRFKNMRQAFGGKEE